MPGVVVNQVSIGSEVEEGVKKGPCNLRDCDINHWLTFKRVIVARDIQAQALPLVQDLG